MQDGTSNLSFRTLNWRNPLRILFAFFFFYQLSTAHAQTTESTENTTEILAEDISSDVILPKPSELQPEHPATPEPTPAPTPTPERAGAAPAPAPAPTPAPAEPAPSESAAAASAPKPLAPAPIKPQLRSQVGFDFVGGYGKYTSSLDPAVSASLVSQAQSAFRFSWRQQLSERVDVDFHTENGQFKPEPPENQNIEGAATWSETTLAVPLLVSSSLPLRLGPLLGYRSEPMIINLTEAAITLDSLPHLMAGLFLEHTMPLQISSKDATLLITSLSAQSIAESSQSRVKILSGQSARLTLGVQHRLSTQVDLSAGVRYEVRDYTTSLGKQQAQDVALSLGLLFSLGRGTP